MANMPSQRKAVEEAIALTGVAELRSAIEKPVNESTTCAAQRYTVEYCGTSVFAAWGFGVGIDVIILVLKIK